MTATLAPPDATHRGGAGTIRAGIYTRLSRVQGANEVNLDIQESDCRALAAERGWPVVEVYSDRVTASGKRQRPGIERLTADVRAGRITALVFYNLDRLYREELGFHTLLDPASASGSQRSSPSPMPSTSTRATAC